MKAPTRILTLSIVGAALSAVFLRNGVLATEDSWSFWEGSVSLLEQHRYTYIDGQPILGEPPAFSLFLALVQAIAGKTGVAMVAAVCLLNFLNAGVWLVFLEQIFRAAGKIAAGPAYWLAAAFIPLFIAVNCYLLVISLLLLTTTGLVFILCLKAAARPWPQNRTTVIWLALALALSTFIHNSALMLLPGVLLALYPSVAQLRFVGKAGVAALFTLIAVGPYFGIWSRGFREHASSGAKGFGPIFERARERAPEWLIGLGNLFVPAKPIPMIQAIALVVGLGLVAWMCCMLRNHFVPRGSAFTVPLLLALWFAFAHYLAFSLIYEPGPLNGRYFWFLPLAIVGPLSIWIAGIRPRARTIPSFLSALPTIGLAGLLFVNPAWRTGRYARHSVVTESRSFPAYHGFIYPDYFLSSRADATPPPGKIAVQPPTFTWMTRWQQKDDPSLAFSAEDIVKLDWFADALKNPTDGTSRFLSSQLSDSTRQLLQQYHGGSDPRLQAALADDLNRISEHAQIYDRGRFAGINLSPASTKLLAQNPQGSELARLNRLLILDAYPPEITKETQRFVRAK